MMDFLPFEGGMMLSEEHRLVSDGVHATAIDISDKLELQEQETRKEIGKKLYQIRRDIKDPMEYSNAIVDLRNSLIKGESPYPVIK